VLLITELAPRVSTPVVVAAALFRVVKVEPKQAENRTRLRIEYWRNIDNLEAAMQQPTDLYEQPVVDKKLSLLSDKLARTLLDEKAVGAASNVGSTKSNGNGAGLPQSANNEPTRRLQAALEPKLSRLSTAVSTNEIDKKPVATGFSATAGEVKVYAMRVRAALF